MKLRVRPGPRSGWGRVDVKEGDTTYVIKGRLLKATTIGRFKNPCLVFPLEALGLKVGDEVEVEEVLQCKMCGAR